MWLLDARCAIDILLVEDNDDHAYIIRKSMDEEWPEAQLHHRSDGLSALEFLKQKSSPVPGLALLDLRLPHMSGHELLGIIKLHHQWRNIPAIILTTSHAEDDVRHAYEQHANSYLQKPNDYLGYRQLVRSLYDYWAHWHVAHPAYRHE